MNISSLTSSTNLDALLATDTTSTSSAADTQASGTSSTSLVDQLAQELDGSGTSTTSPLYKDTVKLLTDLASGNTSAAKADIAGLQKDLKSQSSSSSSSTTDSPLQKLLSSLSTSLDSGNASAALGTLASYLIQNGSGSGTLINTTA
jgi:hypothetical protein